MSVLHSADLNPSSQNISHQSLLIDRAHTQNMGSGGAYNDESRLYQAQPYIEHVQNPQDLYQHLAPSHLLPLQHNDTFQHNTDLYTASPPNTLLTTIDAPSYPKSEQSNAEDLSDALGDLKIDESGVGMPPVLGAVYFIPSYVTKKFVLDSLENFVALYFLYFGLWLTLLFKSRLYPAAAKGRKGSGSSNRRGRRRETATMYFDLWCNYSYST